MIDQRLRPDILDCLANLSSDEVFTPPKLALEMLDLLPKSLWSNPKARFIDPFTKSGVFLREIVKRLDAGLAKQIPDKDERIRHILGKQVFGIAITHLTAHFSRRTLYCNKEATNPLAAARDLFGDKGGNILFKPCFHKWVGESCSICGASKKAWGTNRSTEVENYAYPFLHDEEILKMATDLGFDVVIGNPPYQMKDGGHEASAMPIYQKFVEQALKLKPRFLVMIIPARWYVSGRGLDEFRGMMLQNKHIRELHDFPFAADCFPGVEIKGGVCYFRWEKESEGPCKVYNHMHGNTYSSTRYLLEPGMDTFIRTSIELDVVKKVNATTPIPISDRMESGRYFGFHTQVTRKGVEGTLQTADGASTFPIRFVKGGIFNVKVYIAHGECWINRKDVVKNGKDIDRYKLLVPNVGNPGSTVLGRMKISEPGSCSSNTYNLLVCKSKVEAENARTYFKTKFARFLVAIKTTTQHTPPKTFSLVPQQDFSKPWTDEELYAKYKLTQSEIDFIESMIRPMEDK